jgi:hypothetical protein
MDSGAEPKPAQITMGLMGPSEAAVAAAKRILAHPPNEDAALIARLILQFDDHYRAQLDGVRLLAERQGLSPPTDPPSSP